MLLFSRYLFLTITLTFFLAGCAKNQAPYTPHFTFNHTKAGKCDDYWLLLEKLIENRNARCTDLIPVDAFPYLRGNRELLAIGDELADQKAISRWIGLMRDVDMQTRYLELDALSDDDWALLCNRTGILNCEQGRLRAKTARCSALLLGDERREHSFITRLKHAISEALKRGYPEKGRKCYDTGNLDGIIPDNPVKAITDPSSGYKGGAALEKRINRLKSMSQGGRR